METMAGVLISPKIEAKIKNREAAYRLQNKSPSFKDVLRERFRNRVKRNRKQLFQQSRNLDIKDTLTGYLRSEIDDISKCEQIMKVDNANDELIDIDEQLSIMEDVQAELLEEQLKYVLDNEYEEMIEDLYTLCPVCMHGQVVSFNNDNDNNEQINCTYCNFRIQCKYSDFRSSLQTYVQQHEKLCTVNPTFSFEKNTNGLYIVCLSCLTFDRIC